MPLVKEAAAFSPSDYLEWEKGNEIKHEYLDGEVFAMGGDVFAMAGASDAHVTVAGNIFAILRNHARGSSCRTYMADMKVRVETANAFYYPDVMVTCDPRDTSAEYFKSHPALIVEVLSPSTAAFDRGKKFAAYRTLESLSEYMLVETDAINVEIFRRDASGHWVLYTYAKGEEVELQSAALKMPIDAIYEDVAFEAALPS
ncbi:MAG: Uma2 family endonuclease [Sulfuricellaceae bacterium]|nr:Uma2 family endonuclease [Sulfuricellaceae bacterium]